MTQLADDLRAARALVKKGWCQKESARTATGAPTVPYSHSAVCFCAEGALRRIGIVDDGPLFDAFRRAIKTTEIYRWNDMPGRTQAEVIRAFDRAISLATKGPQE